MSAPVFTATQTLLSKQESKHTVSSIEYLDRDTLFALLAPYSYCFGSKPAYMPVILWWDSQLY